MKPTGDVWARVAARAAVRPARLVSSSAVVPCEAWRQGCSSKRLRVMKHRAGRRVSKGQRVKVRREQELSRGVNDHGLAQLRRLTELVGVYFGADAECIRGVALLVRAAGLAGYELTPTPVALAVQGPHGSVALGVRAADAFGAPAPAAVNGWQTAGHLIATLAKPAYLLDPTLSQVSEPSGLTAAVLVEPVETLTPHGASFDFTRGAAGVRYYLEPSDTTWRLSYDEQYNQCAPVAQDLLEVLRAGPNARFLLQ